MEVKMILILRNGSDKFLLRLKNYNFLAIWFSNYLLVMYLTREFKLKLLEYFKPIVWIKFLNFSGHVKKKIILGVI